MNPYLEPQGFLGTGASLLADLTLVGYLVLLIPGMLLGFAFARRRLYRPHHKWLMIGITLLNWILIVALMLVAYRFDVIENITRQPGNSRYLLPTIHGLLGLPAQLLATYIVIGMLREDRNVARARARGERDVRRYFFRGAKSIMWSVLALWLATAAFGVLSYLVRYNVLVTTPAAGAAQFPALTPEVTTTDESRPPSETPEATLTGEPQPPLATPEVMPTSEISAAEVFPPAETPEVVSPVETPEVDDGGRGRGRGRGRGGDQNDEDDD